MRLSPGAPILRGVTHPVTVNAKEDPVNALLLAFALSASTQPALPAAADLSALFEAQRVAAMREITREIRADLARRGTDFFATEGGLRRLLDATIVTETGLAAR